MFSPYAELPESDCKLVNDVLTMFSVIKTGLERLDPTEHDPLVADHGPALRFQGFDGNDPREGKMSSYVTYMRRRPRTAGAPGPSSSGRRGLVR